LAEKGQVNCHCCSGNCRKSGSYRNRNRIVQRYACDRCGKSFSESQPLDGLRVDFKRAAQVVHLLCEGMGIRAIERFTQLNRRTVLGILETAGEKCARLLDAKVRNVKTDEIQADEIHTFVGCKAANTTADDMERGDFFSYLAISRHSKLIISSLVGKRTGENTDLFLSDLRQRVNGTFQLTTDAAQIYCGWNGVRKAFGNSITYATETKYFGKPVNFVNRRLIGVKRIRRIGKPDMRVATTCHCERTNLSVRTFTRRFTRCTLGYSKKADNLKHAVAMFVAHFNFCRVHSANGLTPAHTAGLTDHTWTIEEMLESAI
jgi:transposase-like protein